MEEYSYPLIQEPHDPNHIIQEEQESRDRLKEALDQFQATMECVVQQVKRVENIEPPQLYQEEPPSYYEPSPQFNETFHPPQSLRDETLGVLVQGQEEMKRDVQNFMAALDAVTNQLASQCLDTQGTLMATCGESNEEHSMKERLETPVGNEGSCFVLEQLEEALIVEDKEEVVEDLGDAELPWEHRVEENPSKMIEIDAREKSAHLPRHIPYEDLDGIEQELSSHGNKEQASSPSSGESFELEEPSPGAFEKVVEVNSFHPPNYSLIKGKGLDSLIINEQRIELEKSWEEVAVPRNRRTGVGYALSRSLEASLPRWPSTPSLEWVKFISISFIVPLEYGLLETDGQLRILCGMKRKRKMFRGWEVKIIENPSKKIEFDVEEESAQPPKQFLNEDLEGMKQELSSLGDEDHASNHLGGESFEFEEPSPNEIESNVEVDFSQPPIYDLSDGEELDEIDEQRIGSEEAYEEVEINKEEHKGVKLASTLKIPLPQPPPSILSFKWVNSLYSSFIIPLEYGLLETDGQLRHICGFKSKKKMASGWKHYSRLIMVACSKLNCKVWCRARLFGSRRMFGHFIENPKVMPPKWNNDNQLEDGCGNKIWDPGIHEDQFWEPMVCEELHQGLKILKLTNGAYWRFKHWWMFKDNFKYKSP
ncbi:uncharacterized protein DS421_19g645540 [Arachis hypogaea]|uniref:Uncharacterized protein n=1 Tax=Arachis hypogaea TaxID=3818 RepID=A0A6B9V5M3_ARAHY|nr:uncharacterized protein DS421_19g645540 [Arachis hypogaea]